MNKSYHKILEQIKKNKNAIDDLKPNDKILVIDGLNTFIRCFAVNPTTNDDGIHIGGMIGFLKSIAYSIKLCNPTRCIIVFDGKGGSYRRRKLYSGYKNKRKPTRRFNRSETFLNYDDEKRSMVHQLQRLVDYLEYLPVDLISIDQIEADDVMAYLTKQVFVKSDVTLMSTDKDFLQLVDDRVSVWSPTKKVMYNPDKVLEDYGIPSHNFLLYRVLDGDKSDSVPGIKGAGIKTIQKRLPIILEDKKLDLDDLIKYSDEHKDEAKVLQTIIDSKSKLDLNFKLMQLEDVDISGSAKTKIMDMADKPITRLNKFKFQKLFMEDKMWNGLPNLNSWLLTHFNILTKFSEMTQPKEVNEKE